MYVYQHYPLALYRGGSYMAVASAQEEEAARAEGWTDYHTDRAMESEAVAISPQEVAEIEAGDDHMTLVVAAIKNDFTPAKRGPGRPKKQR